METNDKRDEEEEGGGGGTRNGLVLSFGFSPERSIRLGTGHGLFG